MSILGQGPSPRKNPSSAMGRTLLGMDVAEDKGGGGQPATGNDTPDHFTEQEKYSSRKEQQRKWKCQREKLP